jgi:hypothetical protein
MDNRKLRIIFYCILGILFFLFCFIKPSNAVGIEVSPSRFYFTSFSRERILQIKNNNGEEIDVNIFADNLDDVIILSDKELFLKSGETKQVKVAIQGERFGVSKSMISVTAKERGVSDNFGTWVGVKIPVEISSYITWSILQKSFLFLGISILIAYFVSRYRRKKT